MPGEWRLYSLTGIPDHAESLFGPAPRDRLAGLSIRLPRGRAARVAAIATPVVLAAGIGYLAQRGDGILPEAAVATGAAAGIAILPFDVRGGPELAGWRKGMVDLLSTNLDGAGGLRSIDSRTVLARWRERVKEGEEPDLATALC